MITERYLERDGDRLLLRFCVYNSAALDVLTDDATLASAAAALEASDGRGLNEHRLGSFGSFDVTLSWTDPDGVAISVDGPNVGEAFAGDQCVVFYPTRAEVLELLQLRSAAPAV